MGHASCWLSGQDFRFACGYLVVGGVFFLFFFFFNGILISIALQHGAICSWQLSKRF